MEEVEKNKEITLPSFILNAPKLMEEIFSRKIGRDISNKAQLIFKKKSSDPRFIKSLKKACIEVAEQRFETVAESYKRETKVKLNKKTEPGKTIWEDVLSTLIIEVLWEISLKESIDHVLRLHGVIPSREVKKKLAKELFRDGLTELSQKEVEAILLKRLGVNVKDVAAVLKTLEKHDLAEAYKINNIVARHDRIGKELESKEELLNLVKERVKGLGADLAVVSEIVAVLRKEKLLGTEKLAALLQEHKENKKDLAESKKLVSQLNSLLNSGGLSLGALKRIVAILKEERLLKPVALRENLSKGANAERLLKKKNSELEKKTKLLTMVHSRLRKLGTSIEALEEIAKVLRGEKVTSASSLRKVFETQRKISSELEDYKKAVESVNAALRKGGIDTKTLDRLVVVLKREKLTDPGEIERLVKEYNRLVKNENFIEKVKKKLKESGLGVAELEGVLSVLKSEGVTSADSLSKRFSVYESKCRELHKKNDLVRRVNETLKKVKGNLDDVDSLLEVMKEEKILNAKDLKRIFEEAKELRKKKKLVKHVEENIPDETEVIIQRIGDMASIYRELDSSPVHDAPGFGKIIEGLAVAASYPELREQIEQVILEAEHLKKKSRGQTPKSISAEAPKAALELYDAMEQKLGGKAKEIVVRIAGNLDTMGTQELINYLSGLRNAFPSFNFGGLESTLNSGDVEKTRTEMRDTTFKLIKTRIDQGLEPSKVAGILSKLGV